MRSVCQPSQGEVLTSSQWPVWERGLGIPNYYLSKHFQLNLKIMVFELCFIDLVWVSFQSNLKILSNPSTSSQSPLTLRQNRLNRQLSRGLRHQKSSLKLSNTNLSLVYCPIFILKWINLIKLHSLNIENNFCCKLMRLQRLTIMRLTDYFNNYSLQRVKLMEGNFDI